MSRWFDPSDPSHRQIPQQPKPAHRQFRNTDRFLAEGYQVNAKAMRETTREFESAQVELFDDQPDAN